MLCVVCIVCVVGVVCHVYHVGVMCVLCVSCVYHVGDMCVSCVMCVMCVLHQIEDIFTVGLQREQDPCGVVVCHRNRISLQTLNGDCINVVTSTDLHSSVYFTSHSDTLLGQVDVRESSGQLAWGSGVKSCEAIKIYDYTRGLISQSISCRQRHVVTALNFGDSPPNMVVSGNTDYK